MNEHKKATEKTLAETQQKLVDITKKYEDGKKSYYKLKEQTIGGG